MPAQLTPYYGSGSIKGAFTSKPLSGALSSPASLSRSLLLESLNLGCWAILKTPSRGRAAFPIARSAPGDCASQPLPKNTPNGNASPPRRYNNNGSENVNNNNAAGRPQASSHRPPLTAEAPPGAEGDEWQSELPPFPKITADDERLASVEGHFVSRLQDAGLIGPDGGLTSLGSTRVAQLQATYIHLMINKMLSMNRRYQTVLAVVRDVGSFMSPVNLATAMHRLGRLARAARATNPSLPSHLCQHPQYQFMLQRAEETMSEMAPRAMANFLWGMAAMGDRRNTGIVLRLGQRLLEIDPKELKTQELSNVVWSMATLEVHMPQMLDAMLDSACDRIDDCVPQALSNMIWACATLKHEHPRFVYTVAASAAPRLHTFQSQTLANTLWAYSVLGVYPPELFENAAEEIVKRLGPGGSEPERPPSHPANRQDQHQRPGYSNNNTSNRGGRSKYDSKATNNSGGNKEWRKPFDSQQSMPDLCDFRGQEISNVLIAYARGCIIHPALLQAVERELCLTSSRKSSEQGQSSRVESLSEFTSQALANTLWAFATLRWYPARLLPCVTEAMTRIVPQMTAQELANSLWSYARFAYHPGRVMASFLAIIEQRIEEFEGQGCTNSLWALAVLKATHSAAFVGLLQQYVHLERNNSNLFGELQYNQVLQAVLLAQFEARGGRVAWRPEVDLPEDLVDRALSAWASQQTSTQLSGFHLDVSEGLTRLGIPHHIEYLVARDLLSIDIAVTADGRQIAIEVDGPFHFPVNARTPLGHTMIRRRLLRAANWIVVSIPWYEWFAKQTWEERLQYLAEVLSRADDTLGQKLKPEVKNLLSTEFSPGPGISVEDEEGADAGAAAGAGGLSSLVGPALDVTRITASGSYDEGEDGPVLSYDGDIIGTVGPVGVDSEIETGLMEVLGRSNVQLTSGAVRRLQSMGLEDLVRQIGDRRRSSYMNSGGGGGGGGGGGSSGNRSSGTAGVPPGATASVYGSAGSRPDTYCPPPSLPNVDGNVLLPKPSRLRASPSGQRNEQGGNRGARFNPRFYNTSSSTNWGFYSESSQDEGSGDERGGGRGGRKKPRYQRPTTPPLPVRESEATSGLRQLGSGGSPEMFRRALHDTSKRSTSNGSPKQDEDQKGGSGGTGTDESIP